MGNRGSAVKPVSKTPSTKEKKITPAKKPPTPTSASRDSSKTTPEKDKTQRRTGRTQPAAIDAPAAVTPAKKKRDEVENRTAKEVDKRKESQKNKRKSSGKYVDGNWVSAEGTKKKTSRSTTNKTSSSEGRTEKKKKTVSENSKRKSKKDGSEKSKKKRATKTEELVDRTNRTTEQTADEKTQDSSAKRKRMAKSSRSKKDGSKKTVHTEQTEKTEKTRDEKTVPTFEDDNTLVSDPPKRKKYTEDKEEKVKEFLKGMIGKGVNGLKEEFGGLKKEIVQVKKDEIIDIYSEFSLPINSKKNRYKDVPRLNGSKVVLKDRKEDQSYIHANYCTTHKGEKRFICTQGPTEATYDDFWTMICQEEVEHIVMLCNFLEMGKPKCDKYFPLGEGEILSTTQFNIHCESVHGNKFPETVTIRKLIVTKKGEEKEYKVDHLHWESWPDRGVPPVDQSIFKLLARVSKSSKPIAVHCSAGIGRTGTMVVVQMALEMLSAGQSLSEGLSPILKRLRKQRAMSVQNETQYIFIHRVLLEYFKDAIEEDEASQFCADYEKLTK